MRQRRRAIIHLDSEVSLGWLVAGAGRVLLLLAAHGRDAHLRLEAVSAKEGHRGAACAYRCRNECVACAWRGVRGDAQTRFHSRSRSSPHPTRTSHISY